MPRIKLNQNHTTTLYNRYPKVFQEIKDIVIDPKNILSFGCSTGEECITMQELYFTNANIVGYDINKHIIQNNILQNKFKNINYYFFIDDITQQFDLIFANTVLCRVPDISMCDSCLLQEAATDRYVPNIGPHKNCSNSYIYPNCGKIYSFQLFEETLEIIDSLLKVNGYICIYNSKYLFTETNLFKNKYEIIHTNYNYPGFIEQYYKNNVPLNEEYTYFLFKKRSH
tara:strand:+ start:10637 stop:11317 length:681 start_codon:yes stop_codon:yes gene_type:complete